jgi:hypothetical protein
MVQQLHGFVYEDETVRVTFEGVAVVSVGRNCAESWSGADLSVVATISQPGRDDVRKAILLQSKRGRVEQLKTDEYERLLEQIEDMRALTRHTKVLEISTAKDGVPKVVSASGLIQKRKLQHQNFGDWIAKRVIPTFDGDTRPDFIRGVLDARLSQLRVHARKK